MAYESRNIVFSEEELVSAALDYCRHARIAVPDASIEHLDISAAPEPSVVLRFRVGCPMDIDQIAVAGKPLVAALVRFCNQHEIPLPRNSEKILRCESGKITMHLEIKHRARCKAAAYA